jgi:hypothetical protein
MRVSTGSSTERSEAEGELLAALQATRQFEAFLRNGGARGSGLLTCTRCTPAPAGVRTYLLRAMAALARRPPSSGAAFPTFWVTALGRVLRSTCVSPTFPRP